MSLREDIAPYLNRYGLVTPRIGAATGNGIRDTSIYYILLSQHGLLTEGDKLDFVRIMELCEIEPGLLKRSPEGGSLETWDDYIGYLAACSALGLSELAGQVLNYGEAHGFSFNSDHPGGWTGKSFMGRSPSFIAHCHFASERYCPAFDALAWAASLFSAGRNARDQDSFTLSWLMLQTKGWQESRLCQWAARGFRQRLRDAGGMREILTAYYGFSHPLAVYQID